MAPRRSAPQALSTVVCAILVVSTPSTPAAQGVDILTTLGSFVGGFRNVTGFVAPAGFIESDVLQESGEIQEFGIVARNESAGLLVGVDILTGFRASRPDLTLRGSILALPNIMAVHQRSLPFGKRPALDAPPGTRRIPVWANVGFGLGLSQLQNVRTQIPQALSADRVIEMKGNGFHTGVTYGLSTLVGGAVGIFVDGSLRYTRFPSLDWREADKAIVPPVGWPLSMSHWTGTVRIGMGTPPPPPR